MASKDNNTLFLPFIDENEIDSNKVTINEFSFQNYITSSLRFLKKLKTIDQLSKNQFKQSQELTKILENIILNLKNLEKNNKE